MFLAGWKSSTNTCLLNRPKTEIGHMFNYVSNKNKLKIQAHKTFKPKDLLILFFIETSWSHYITCSLLKNPLSITLQFFDLCNYTAFSYKRNKLNLQSTRVAAHLSNVIKIGKITLTYPLINHCENHPCQNYLMQTYARIQKVHSFLLTITSTKFEHQLRLQQTPKTPQLISLLITIITTTLSHNQTN